MTVFSKTASFNDLVPLLPALDLPVTLKMLFSYRNFVHALAGAVVSNLRFYTRCWSNCLSGNFFTKLQASELITCELLVQFKPEDNTLI